MVEKITDALTPTIKKEGYDVIAINLTKVKGELILEVIIDKKDGIDLDDCVTVTKLINPVLDEQDLIEESYTLEVMSKGVEDGQQDDDRSN